MPDVVVGPVHRGNVVCDLDGVVYLHDRPIPGSGEALRRLVDLGLQVLFVTNNSTIPRAEVAERIGETSGYPARAEQVITSSEAAVELLEEGDTPCLVVGGEGIRSALRHAGLGITGTWEEARSVVCGLDRDLTYDRLRDAVLALRNGARFVATNDDPTFPTPGGLWPGAGAMVAALETGSSRRPEVAGKPHRAMRRVVRRHLREGPTWVVGDRPSTDLAMARREGWTGVLVLTGVTSRSDVPRGGGGAELVLERLANLPDLLAEGGGSTGAAASLPQQ